jgi:outer membrane protein assembly factor BamD (BamD/ComL family)
MPIIMYRSLFSLCRYALALVLLGAITGCRKTSSPKSLKAKREHSREIGSQKPQRRLREMSEPEAVHAAEYYEKIGPQDLIISAYQRVIAVSLDPEIIATYTKKLADLYLADSNYKEAKKYYHKFVSLYPGHSLITDVRYHEILTHFLSSLSPQRDQTATHHVITLGKQYLADYPEQRTVATVRCMYEKVIEMIGASYQRLLFAEISIIRFYLNKFSIDQLASSLHAATQRLVRIITHTIPDMRPFVPQLEAIAAQLSLPEQHETEPTPDLFSARIDEIMKNVHILESFLAADVTPSYSTAYFRDKF